MNISFIENTTDNLMLLISNYSEHLTGPTDDFWEEHILNAKLYAIINDELNVGFFTIYDLDKLTTFYIEPDKLCLAQPIFKRILTEFRIKTAFVPTCDELFLSLCLDFHKTIEMQAYFFNINFQNAVRPPEFDRSCLTEIEPCEIDDVNKQTDGFFSDMSESQLSKRECVIYRMAENKKTLGYGVIVPDKTRPSLWACGMIVLPEYRLKGIGRSIQFHLSNICFEDGKTPVSGCWYQNHLSKKTIESAGRYTKTRLLNVHF